MTPERALAHDERCEKYYAWQFDGQMICRCAERALAASRQREEEAKERFAMMADSERIQTRRIAGLEAQLDLMEEERNIWRKDAMEAQAEITRLTLAASESARTVQVEIAEWKVRWDACTAEHVKERAARDAAIDERDALQNQVAALREHLERACAVVERVGGYSITVNEWRSALKGPHV